jgi:hypothetical protein
MAGTIFVKCFKLLNEQTTLAVPTGVCENCHSSATRYCSPKCARKAKRPSGSLDGILVAETIKKTA